MRRGGHNRIRWAATLAGLAMTAAVWLLGAAPVAAAGFCYDEARDLVQPEAAGQCNGRVVDGAEAEALLAAIQDRRSARALRRVQTQTESAESGYKLASVGAAFVVGAAGEALTSAHVVATCDLVRARNPQTGAMSAVSVIALESANDLALLRFEHAPGARAIFAPGRAQDRAPIALVGFPHEGMIPLEPRLTPVWAAYDIADPRETPLLGVRGDVRRGHSGGPAFDSRGELVGLLRAKVDSVASVRDQGRFLANIGVLVDSAPLMAFLRGHGVAYDVAPQPGEELSGKQIFTRARAAMMRVDCYREAK